MLKSSENRKDATRILELAAKKHKHRGFHRFFFSSHIRFLLACEEKQASKKKVRERAKRVKSKKMRGKSEHLSDFRIMRVKNPASKTFKCE